MWTGARKQLENTAPTVSTGDSLGQNSIILSLSAVAAVSCAARQSLSI